MHNAPLKDLLKYFFNLQAYRERGQRGQITQRQNCTKRLDAALDYGFMTPEAHYLVAPHPKKIASMT